MQRPGDHLRKMRLRLGITTRAVEEMSRPISEAKGSGDYFISHARIIQVENGESTPSIYKLYTLSAIYGSRVTDLMSLYIDGHSLAGHQIATNPLTTRPIDFEAGVALPPSSASGRAEAQRTTLSPGLKGVPAALFERFCGAYVRYGYIGLHDYTMYPLLRPGAIIQIDERQKLIATRAYRDQSERPIYFLESHEGYICAWCEMHGKRLFALPHPLSPCGIREFSLPNDVEILGRVVAVFTHLVDPKADESRSAIDPGRPREGFSMSVMPRISRSCISVGNGCE